MALSFGPVPTFAHQGTVDWVSLGNETVSASVSILRRLAAAKVDVQALSIGHGLGGSFKLSLTGLSSVARSNGIH